jgi:photoactive yellow protein
LWCEKELPHIEIERGNLCSECDQISTGVPELMGDQLDHLPFGVIQINQNGDIITFNQAERMLSGQSQDDVVGRNFFTEIAPCSDVQEFRGRFKEFLNGTNLSERFDYAYYFGGQAVNVQITFLRVNRQLAFVLSKRMTR